MKKILQHIRWFLIQEWKMYALMFVLLLSIATFALIPGWLLGLSIDTIISGGLTWQSLIILTIADNIRFGMSTVSDKEAEDVLREIGGAPLLDKLENGIHQNLSRGGVNLSVGEKQLISFARAIVHNPAIFIMDEATANIDTETEKRIQLALEKARKGRTLIVISHRLSTIKKADKIVVLENGLKVEEGTHDALINRDGAYANMYRAQFKIPH
jgi:ATP-binding cassette subfamily B protein